MNRKNIISAGVLLLLVALTPSAIFKGNDMAAVFAAILKLPPLKQALASKQFKSIYLDKLLSSQIKKNK